MLLNTEKNYGFVSRCFHWVTAIVVICLIFVGLYMHDVTNYLVRKQLYIAHKSFGFLVLLIILPRFIWRLINPVPKLESVIPSYQKFISKLVHWLFYLFLFIMPLSGLTMTFFSGRKLNLFGVYVLDIGISKNVGIARLGHDVHGVLGYTLAFMVGLHIMAALYHHFILRDNVLVRMWSAWPFRKNERSK